MIVRFVVTAIRSRTLSFAALGLALAMGSGCSTVLFVRTPQSRIQTDPLYSSSKPFYVYGLVGSDYHVYTDQICLGREVDQVATFYSLSDVLTGLATLGIFTPRTVGVWCHL